MLDRLRIGVCLINNAPDINLEFIKQKFHEKLKNYNLDFFVVDNSKDNFEKMFLVSFEKRLYEIEHKFTYFANIFLDLNDYVLLDYLHIPDNLHFRTLYYFQGNFVSGLGTGISQSMFLAGSLTFNHACEYNRCYFKDDPHNNNFYKFLKSRQISTICLNKSLKQFFIERPI